MSIIVPGLNNKEFTPSNGMATKKEAEHSAALMVLHYLQDKFLENEENFQEQEVEMLEEISNCNNSKKDESFPNGDKKQDSNSEDINTSFVESKEKYPLWDLTGDSGVVKQIIKEGNGNLPEKGSLVTGITLYKS
jgi:FKBP-type peptidyl-prolyl cis-trans isomerase